MPLNDYDRLAGQYKATDRKPDKFFSILPTVVTMAGDVTGKTVLDLGCGSGFFSRIFADAGAARVIGIDSSRAQIEEARKDVRPNLKYRIGDVFVDPLPGADIVCAPFLVGYLATRDELVSFLSKVRAALPAGGTAVFVVDMPSGKDLKKYGAQKIIRGPLSDGTPMTMDLYDGSGNRICSLNAFFHPEDVIISTLNESGFSSIEKIPPVVSEAGIREFGRAYWDDYLADPELTYYRCVA